MDCLGLLEHVCTDVKVLRNWSSDSKGGVFLSGVQYSCSLLYYCLAVLFAGPRGDWSLRSVASLPDGEGRGEEV